MSTTVIAQNNDVSDGDFAEFFGVTREEFAEMDREMDRMLAEMRQIVEQNKARDVEIAKNAAETRAALQQIYQILGLKP